MENRIGRFLLIDTDAEALKRGAVHAYSLARRRQVSKGNFVQVLVDYPKEIEGKRGEALWVKVIDKGWPEGEPEKLFFSGYINDDVTYGHIHGFEDGAQIEFGVENINRILE